MVKTDVAPTAVASASDHYIVLLPGHPPRFATVEENGRFMGVDPASPLMAMLAGPCLTPNQAVSAVGRGVHAHVARRLVGALLERGTLAPWFTYGSAYSGVDLFAEGARVATGGRFVYVFGSEDCAHLRRALAGAWRDYGLSPDRIYHDARSAPATQAPYVDLFVLTTSCEEHSRRNHDRTAATQEASLRNVWLSLDYVRARRPRVIVVENVCDASVAGPFTGLLSRLQDYRLETGALNPRDASGAPSSRDRQFWVLTLRDPLPTLMLHT
jgi:hypothetical protein